MCYRLLTGQEPGMEKPSELVEGLKLGWDNFIGKGLRGRTVDRYANAVVMNEALGAIVSLEERRFEQERKPEDRKRREAIGREEKGKRVEVVRKEEEARRPEIEREIKAKAEAEGYSQLKGSRQSILNVLAHRVRVLREEADRQRAEQLGDVRREAECKNAEIAEKKRQDTARREWERAGKNSRGSPGEKSVHPPENDPSSLLWACLNQKWDVVRMLLDSRDEFVRRDGIQCTAFQTALLRNAPQDVVEKFLDKGEDVNRVYYWLPPLIAALSDLNTVKLLVSRGAKVSAWDDLKETVLHRAAGQSDGSVIEYLLQHEGDVRSRDLAENTPLHFAARFGSVSAAETLVKNGADVNAQNCHAETSLDNACEENREEMVAFLTRIGGRRGKAKKKKIK